MFKWFPLLIVPVILYNLFVYGDTLFVSEHVDTLVNAPMFTLTLFSGEDWVFRYGDLIILISLACLFVETVKATDTTAVSVINHGLSMAVFVIALIEFLVVRQFATSAFFFLVIMTLMDVVGGFTISIVAAKRDLGTSGGLIGTN